MRKTASILMAALILALSGCNADAAGSNSNSVSPSAVSSGEYSTDSSESTDSESSSDKSDVPSSADSVSESSESISAPESTSREKPTVSVNVQGEELSENGVLTLSDGRAFNLYSGGYEEGQNYAETLNRIKTLVGGGINVFSMVVPTEVSFYLPDDFSDYSGSEWDNIEYLNGFFDGVIPVDAYTALSRHVDEEIYFRTDFHWQQLGAYYAAEEFAREAQVPFAPLSDYETVTMDGYVGSMYGISGEVPLIKDNPETFTYYKPRNEYSADHYSQDLENDGWYDSSEMDGLFLKTLDDIPIVRWYWVFMGGDTDAIHVKTDVGNGRKLLLVKDSFGNAFLPCLTNSFEEIWAVDMRGFQKSISQFVKDNELTDVLFCLNSFSATGVEQENLENIM